MGREAIHRVGRPGDTEALHDFRVALRRCRVLLRAYRPWLGKAAGKRMRGGLGRKISHGSTHGQRAGVTVV
jgi:CHAD domain-containing protein